MAYVNFQQLEKFTIFPTVPGLARFSKISRRVWKVCGIFHPQADLAGRIVYSLEAGVTVLILWDLACKTDGNWF